MEKENRAESLQSGGFGCAEEMEKDGLGAGEECLLDVFTPQSLLARFQSLEDCTSDVVNLIKTVQVNQSKMKKLSRIFCELSNCNTESIVELTRSKGRMLRYISTCLVLGKIKQWVEEGRGFGVVEKMYDEVFLVRFRDVDPHIRSLCVEYMCEWIIAVPEIFNAPSYLKYVGWSLSDKGDGVRRRGVQCVTRLVQKKISLSVFMNRFKSRIVELSLYDKSASVREDGRRLCFLAFLDGLLDRNEAYTVLGSVEERSTSAEKKMLEKVVVKILGEDYTADTSMGLLGNSAALHELLVSTSPVVCSYIPHDSCAATAFVQFVADFLRREGSCCGSESLCFLRIARELVGAVTSIDKFDEILETTRENRHNVREVLECLVLVDVEVYKADPEITNQLLSRIRAFCDEQHCEDVFGLFVRLLKMLEADFSPVVTGIVSFFKTRHTSMCCLIKSFDVSEVVGSGASNEAKCYAMLWRILQRDYGFINACEFRGEPCVELCDFLIFFKEKCVELGVYNESHSIATDEISCFKVAFKKLFVYLDMHLSTLFTDEKSAIMLYKLVENGLMAEHSHLLYELCTEELISELYSRSKSRVSLVAGYFGHLTRHESSDKVSRIARILSARKLEDGRRIVFNSVRSLVEQKKTSLYDSVLICFVPHMSVNECIIVERMVGKSKFKASLLRKCRGGDMPKPPLSSSADITFVG
jgi:cohesin complex subunit SA-1/2